MNKGIIVGAICATLLTTNVFANFSDISKDDWYYDDVIFVKDRGILSGESADIFAPNKNMTRAMLVQIIYNFEHKPEINRVSYYDDVEEPLWYFDAISWATEKGIVKGMGDNKFEPDTFITKEQLVTVLYNYARYKEYDVSVGENTNILSYEDSFTLHEYGYEPMQWACGVGIIKGENNLLNHGKTVTRAEVASIMKRFAQEYVKDCAWVKLDGNATTGYVWSASSYDENIVCVNDYKYYQEENDEMLTGAPGFFEFEVTALNPGKTDIIFEYARSWEKEAIKTVICSVEVSSTGRINMWLKAAE